MSQAFLSLKSMRKALIRPFGPSSPGDGRKKPVSFRPATRRRQRLIMIVSGLSVLGLALGLVLYAMRGTIVFFHSPSMVKEKSIAAGQRFRLGGLVREGSVMRGDQQNLSFDVTDTRHVIAVTYRGLIPDLFREGQGVVTEGKLDASGIFRADTVLARHDENYMPREVADSLKKQGHWHEQKYEKKP
jgi:cytochrome c-type biogenesis protein CcmE